MTRALLSVRFRAMLAAFTAQARQKKKKSRGMMVLFGVLYVYVAVVIAGVMCMMFAQLAGALPSSGAGLAVFCYGGAYGAGLFRFRRRVHDPESAL